MLRVLILFLALLIQSPGLVGAQSSERVQAIRVFLDSGNPKQAIRTAEILLANSNVSLAERESLLSLIAEAEYIRATSRLFDDVKAAVQAIEVLLKEFPDNREAARLRWQRAWLRWKGGDYKNAIINAREIISKDQKRDRLQQAWLLIARIHIEQEKYGFARSELLQYGLQVDEGSREQGIGQAWMALIDIGESRHRAAYKALHKVYRHWPATISANAKLFSAYIHQLHRHGRDKKALQLAEKFSRLFSSKDQAPSIRLLRADILAKKENTIPVAIDEYIILADKQAETIIGRKAFIRKLTLQNRKETNREKLLPAMAAIKKIADHNQLSLLEDEAMLALARLWTQIEVTSSPDRQAEPTRNMSSPALHAYAQAAKSSDLAISGAASQEGATWLSSSILALLDKEDWLKAVAIWQQYPQLRPPKKQSQALRFGIAHAMRKLMLFDTADVLLAELYTENRASITGQRAMLERAKLWLERGDSNAVERIMRWLNANEFTLYRPEILVTVARIQLLQNHAEEALQTLKSVHATDIALESRASYWQTRAETAQSMSRWHTAAKAWKYYRNSEGADTGQGLINQADSLFAAKEFAQALKLYRQAPKQARDHAWQYHAGISQLRSGQTKLGSERLQALASEKNQSMYSSLAKLALADQLAGALLEESP